MTNTLHIYTRHSMNDKSSITQQRDDGIRESKSLGMNYKIWEEDITCEDSVLSSLLLSVKRGDVKQIWVSDTDRISRDEIQWIEFRDILNEHEVNLYVGGDYVVVNRSDDIPRFLSDLGISI